MNSPTVSTLALAAIFAAGTAIASAQGASTPTAPASPVTPAAPVTPPSPGAPEAPVAPGTLPEQAAPAPAAPTPTPKVPTGSAAAQTSVPSGEVAKAQQTGQSAYGGKTTEDAPAPATSARSKRSTKKHKPQANTTPQ